MIEITTDKELIKQVLCHPDVYETIGGDLKPPLDEYEPEDGALYLVGYDPKPYGCFILHQNGSTDWWCHVQVIPEYRAKYAQKFGRDSIQFAFSNIPHCFKLVAQCPLIYPNVVRFAQSFGFEIEGFNRGSYLKNGELQDQYYLGLRKDKWDSLKTQ